MSIDPQYVPSSIDTSAYKFLTGDWLYRGIIESDNADRRTYTITIPGWKVGVIAPVDIYLSLKEKLLPGQVVSVVLNKHEPKYARTVRLVTEGDRATFEAQARARAGASQSHGGASQSQAGASQARRGS